MIMTLIYLKAYKYTLHCFRRGGCQHRYFHTYPSWPIEAIKRWGGWSESEQSDTLIKYILNDHEAR
jgi:hypothetical protein